jgi:hypothetical protein
MSFFPLISGSMPGRSSDLFLTLAEPRATEMTKDFTPKFNRLSRFFICRKAIDALLRLLIR